MKIEGKHKCNSNFGKCDHEYEWMALVPQKISDGNFKIEKLDKKQGSIIYTTEDKYTVKVICPNCHQDNIIEYKRT